jgi:hypothetical protein
MQAQIILHGDLVDLANVIDQSNVDEPLPFFIWWGGTFTVFAKECFRKMGIDVDVNDIKNPPRWEDVKGNSTKMTASEFKEIVIDKALANNNTSFNWGVSALLPAPDAPERRSVKMGKFVWLNEFSDKEVERLAEQK